MRCATATSRQRPHFLKPLHGTRVSCAAGTRPLESELDQAFDEPRIFDFSRFPQLRIHRDVREAGNGIDFVDQDAIRAALEKKVDARVACRADRTNADTARRRNSSVFSLGSFAGITSCALFSMYLSS